MPRDRARRTCALVLLLACACSRPQPRRQPAVDVVPGAPAPPPTPSPTAIDAAATVDAPPAIPQPTLALARPAAEAIEAALQGRIFAIHLAVLGREARISMDVDEDGDVNSRISFASALSPDATPMAHDPVRPAPDAGYAPARTAVVAERGALHAIVVDAAGDPTSLSLVGDAGDVASLVPAGPRVDELVAQGDGRGFLVAWSGPEIACDMPEGNGYCLAPAAGDDFGGRRAE